jgi:hypothetical protein
MKLDEVTEKLFQEASRKSQELSRRIFDQAIQQAWEDGFHEGMKAAASLPAKRKKV